MGYAIKDATHKLTEENVNKIDLSVFDKSIPKQHQMKMLMISGCFLGLRGSSEHTYLATRHILRGEYDIGHKLAGKTWYGIDGTLDKTKKLTVHSSYVRSLEDTRLRLPVMSDDPNSIDGGSCFDRFLKSLAPGQTRLYCQVIPTKFRKRDSPIFYAHKPLGKEKIMELFRLAVKKMGFCDWETFSPHSLRHMFCNQLANDPRVSTKECMLACRHTSVSASANYQSRNSSSDENRLEALGYVLPSVENEKATSSNTLQQVQDSTANYAIVSVEKTVQNSEEHYDHHHNNQQLAYLTQPDFDTTLKRDNSYEQELSSMPSTQAAIEYVKQDMQKFEDDIKKASKISVEREQIIFLGKQLQSVKKKYYSTLKKLTYYEKKYGPKEDQEFLMNTTTVESRKRPAYTSPPLNPYAKMRRKF